MILSLIDDNVIFSALSAALRELERKWFWNIIPTLSLGVQSALLTIFRVYLFFQWHLRQPKALLYLYFLSLILLTLNFSVSCGLAFRFVVVSRRFLVRCFSHLVFTSKHLTLFLASRILDD